ncbi:hypothetical protein CKC_03445 [Candidatus Liberibacter solanacearum CLso-ZC1]|uniref:Uncharacterized protein n=1 Tax=Liberibacter solanacearum (strain CLso-ZC1) TaxID=658172 RepID=E4UBD3_LIBSC|nr:hypothetical protein [Candidatus Liberibacter solanacearum]ADR52438.1 hypothetical protein CKC_03445 [Candidatus Liberibacter solanacearum CLso-ZC1]
MVFRRKRTYAYARSNFGRSNYSRYSKPRNRFTGFMKNGRWYYYKSKTLKNRSVRSGNRVYKKKNVGQQGLVLQLPSGTQVVNVNTRRKYTKSRF